MGKNRSRGGGRKTGVSNEATPAPVGNVVASTTDEPAPKDCNVLEPSVESVRVDPTTSEVRKIEKTPQKRSVVIESTPPREETSKSSFPQTPGSAYSTGSMRYESIYPDIVSEGENIDYYRPEVGDEVGPSTLPEGLDASIQDIYQDIRSPVYTGAPPGSFFGAVSVTSLTAEEDDDDVTTVPRYGDVDTLADGERAAQKLSAAASHSYQSATFSKDVINAFAVKFDDATVPEEITSEVVSNDLRQSWGPTETLYQYVVLQLTPYKTLSDVFDLTSGSAAIDQFVDRFQPVELMNTFIPLPRLIMETLIAFPRLQLLVALLVLQVLVALSSFGLRIWLFWVALPLRIGEKSAISVSQALIARGVALLNADRRTLVQPERSDATNGLLQVPHALNGHVLSLR